MIPGPPIAITAAFAAANRPEGDTKIITGLIPSLLQEENAQAASVLIRTISSYDCGWLPEALILFHIKTLSLSQKKEMLKGVFSYQYPLSTKNITAWSDCNARIGRLGFSFPQWRFLAQVFDGSSLLERFGMRKLERQTDIRDPSLPKSDPQRDEYGTGFVYREKEWSIEFRRAYILCSNDSDKNRATLVIRNNSYFFGRDRLPAPAFISWQRLSPSALDNTDHHSFSESGPFIKWRDAFRPDKDMPIPEKLRRTKLLLDQIDNFDQAFSLWLQKREGREHLTQFTRHLLARQAATGKTEPPFYLAVIESDMPPWFPHYSVPASSVAPELCADVQNQKLVLLSGPNGDFPVRPEPKISSNTSHQGLSPKRL